MNLFELVFILLFFTLIFAVLRILWLLCAGRVRNAGRLALRTLLTAVAYYLIVVIIESVRPQRIVMPDTDACADEWCLAVANSRRTADVVSVDLRVSSRARRRIQRERNVTVFLIDSDLPQSAISALLWIPHWNPKATSSPHSNSTRHPAQKV